jgi:hypothetical protein
MGTFLCGTLVWHSGSWNNFVQDFQAVKAKLIPLFSVLLSELLLFSIFKLKLN